MDVWNWKENVREVGVITDILIFNVALQKKKKEREREIPLHCHISEAGDVDVDGTGRVESPK